MSLSFVNWGYLDSSHNQVCKHLSVNRLFHLFLITFIRKMMQETFVSRQKNAVALDVEQSQVLTTQLPHLTLYGLILKNVAVK